MTYKSLKRFIHRRKLTLPCVCAVDDGTEIVLAYGPGEPNHGEVIKVISTDQNGGPIITDYCQDGTVIERFHW